MERDCAQKHQDRKAQATFRKWQVDIRQAAMVFWARLLLYKKQKPFHISSKKGIVRTQWQAHRHGRTGVRTEKT